MDITCGLQSGRVTDGVEWGSDFGKDLWFRLSYNRLSVYLITPHTNTNRTMCFWISVVPGPVT